MDEGVRCTLCGSSETIPRFETFDRLLDLPGAWRYAACRACGAVFLHPQPAWSHRAAHYAPAYRGYDRLASQPARLQRGSMAYGLRKRLRIVERHVQGGRLLDAGCAGGDFVAVAQATGRWQAMGLERVAALAAAARRDHGAAIVEGDLSAAGLAQDTFDALTLWTALEHMDDPSRALREAARLLRPGGVLVIRTIAPHGWGQKLFGACWAGFDAPRVLFLFPPATLAALLNETGFTVLEVSSTFHEFHPYVWSWRNGCAARLPAGSARRMLTALAASWPVRLLTAPYFLLQTALGGNGYYTVVAAKGKT
jgi:2-polyprenyl-3-methyl-5-hydroxy-6-metoxy-1,4-benzoquinol methylase